MDEEEEAEEALKIIEEVLADPSTTPRKRRATAVASTIASTNRPGLGQSVSVEASAVGSFDGVAARDTVQEIDEFGSVVVDEGSEHRHVSKRAKARASSKGKEGAADPKSSKKRPAPGAGASTTTRQYVTLSLPSISLRMPTSRSRRHRFVEPPRHSPMRHSSPCAGRLSRRGPLCRHRTFRSYRGCPPPRDSEAYVDRRPV